MLDYRPIIIIEVEHSNYPKIRQSLDYCISGHITVSLGLGMLDPGSSLRWITRVPVPLH